MKNINYIIAVATLFTFASCGGSKMEQTPDMMMSDVVGPVKSISSGIVFCQDEDFKYDKSDLYWTETKFDEKGRFTLFSDITIKYDEEGNISRASAISPFSDKKVKVKVKRNDKGFISVAKFDMKGDFEDYEYCYKYSFYDNGKLKKYSFSGDPIDGSVETYLYDEAGHLKSRNEIYEIIKTDDHGNWTEIHSSCEQELIENFIGDEGKDDMLYIVKIRKVKYYDE